MQKKIEMQTFIITFIIINILSEIQPFFTTIIVILSCPNNQAV